MRHKLGRVHGESYKDGEQGPKDAYNVGGGGGGGVPSFIAFLEIRLALIIARERGRLTIKLQRGGMKGSNVECRKGSPTRAHTDRVREEEMYTTRDVGGALCPLY